MTRPQTWSAPQILETDGAYVLQPCAGVTDAQIKSFFQDGLQYAGLRQEHASVIMENAGTGGALYASVKKQLQDGGATVYDVTYHGIPLTQSLIYIANSQPLTQQFLQQALGVTAQPKPDSMTAQADLVVIVADSKPLASATAGAGTSH